MSSFKMESFKSLLTCTSLDRVMTGSHCMAVLFKFVSSRTTTKKNLLCSEGFVGVYMRLTFALIFRIYWYHAVNITYQVSRVCLCSVLGISNIEMPIFVKCYLFNWGYNGKIQQKLLVITWSSSEVVWLDYCRKKSNKCLFEQGATGWASSRLL